MPARAGARPSLATAINDRRNAVNLLRFGFALMVIVSHSYPLGVGGGDPHLPATSLGGFAVTGFFLLSGFLITRSAARSRSVGEYAWRRALRILPGYWVCLLVTAFALAPLMALHAHAAGRYFTSSSPWTYPINNLAVIVRQPVIAGLPGHVAHPGDLNGSLWTLWWEALCYVGIGVVAAAGCLRRPRVLLAALGTSYALTVLVSAHPDLLGHSSSPYAPGAGAHLVVTFLVGACFHLFADRIPIRTSLFGAAVAVAAASQWVSGTVGAAELALALPALGYVWLWLGFRLPVRSFGVRRDVSYGLYVYAFPVQQLLATWGVGRHGVALFMLASVASTLVLAHLSWWAVESPALRQKARWPQLRRAARAVASA